MKHFFFFIWPVRLSICVVMVQPVFFVLFLFVFLPTNRITVEKEGYIYL